jgi:hypothetical protein
MAAQSLEANDNCYLGVDSGSGWTIVASLSNGEDDRAFRSGVVDLGADADDNPNLRLRYRAAGVSADYCYAEDTTVSAGGPGASRTELTRDDLVFGPQSSGPVNDAALAPPASAGPPLNVFEGRLILQGEASGGGFLELRDDFLYTGSGDDPRKHLPEFDFELVQDANGALIPLQRGNINTAHPYWTWILGPGQVWSEPADEGASRASLPFALVQRNSNCTHNGTLTFLFDDVAVSKVHYQITQETCLYYKFDLWGLLDASYQPQPVSDSAEVKAAFAAELAARMPSKPIGDLTNDFPGTDLSAFGADITAEHMTAYGLVVDGTNYVSNCATRYGNYPYCGWMSMPSYSAAKSFFAGLATMRLAEQYDSGIYDLLIRDYVPEAAAANGDWTSVTFEHAADMVTGNYQSSLFMVDDGSAKMDNEFYLVESHAEKIAGAFSWPNKAQSGTSWVYHTADTYILTQALQGYLESWSGAGADIFDYLVDEIFVPLNLSPSAQTSLRTSDDSWNGRPFGGYGLWFLQDDVAKLGQFLATERGAIDGIQLLDPVGLDAALQLDPADRGYDTTGSKPLVYNNGFWGREFTTDEGYACDFWVPFASGFGGITVALMPNGVTYYYFSDNDEFSWVEAVAEIDRSIASLDSGAFCQGGSNGGAVHVEDIIMFGQQIGRNQWRAEAMVTIRDASGAPVADVEVTGSFTGSTSSKPSGTTNAAGQVTLVSKRKKDGGSWSFCVADVSKTGWSYDSGDNLETCDSITAP